MILAGLILTMVMLLWGANTLHAGPGGGTYYANSPAGGASGTALRKFVDSLPGLGASSANNLGQYLPVAVADTITYPGSDYYEIAIREYAERMHSDLPKATRLRGYVQTNNGTDAAGQNTVAPAGIHYLGPIIVAQRDRPVRIKFTNDLPTGTAGNLFIPVDTTLMGAGTGPLAQTCDPITHVCVTGPNPNDLYTENRSAIHLHGGNTPWISDGTPHQWITPAGETTIYPKGVSVVNVPDMQDPGNGSTTVYYTNQQSSRLMFYHDHALGITRLNVYAGIAAGYLIQDDVEKQLVNSGAIPSVQVPLIIQDKTFVPQNIAVQDSKWDTAKWGTYGDLWFPHVYETNQDPSSPDGANPFGRWDYGPWFWPPMNPATLKGALPEVSTTPEAFMDTMLVNGTAYPYMNVEKRRYRFRVLNASNDRFLNLQLYYADASGKEVAMVPALPTSYFPARWPTDSRVGGVPNPRKIGPTMIQIGTEGGFLPAPVELLNTPVGYNYNRRDITVLNISDHTLYMGPAERADIIVDFSKVPAGSKIILYNDAPAPVPAFDPRLDYYTGNQDQSASGGWIPTVKGYGPNTRTVMQFRVVGNSGTLPPETDTYATTLAKLNDPATGLPHAFAKSQPTPIVPQTAYGSPTDTYAEIFSNSLTFTPIGGNAPVTRALEPKAIHELFEPNYGRMNAVLGVELPFTNFLTQTTIPYFYVDPTTEVVTEHEPQLWKITHNGVDTHAIHFHLVNVQLINRIGWDGAKKPPDANEVGWKETVKMNPLEDVVVAMKPKKQILPFAMPTSSRPLAPSNPLHTTMDFTGVDPNNQPITVSNEVTDFGWEYVWHCHLLGHEENDMMRPLIMQAGADLPLEPLRLSAAVAVPTGTQVDLAWSASTPNATGYTVQRATGAAGITTAFSDIGAVAAGITSYSDATTALGTTYTYRVVATNGTGSSDPSNWVSITTAAPGAPWNLFATTPPRGQTQVVSLSWNEASNNEGWFTLQRATNAAFTRGLTSFTLGANTSSFADTTVAGRTTYYYRVLATNTVGSSAYSKTKSIATK
jgi:FtsP/CotA-like multicopper oxidase with cupredoxin domain